MPERSLVDLLTSARARGQAALIVDIKQRSPRDSVLIPAARFEEYVRSVVEAGAQALAMPTHVQHFGGSVLAAPHIRRLSGLPLLRKDVFTSAVQMDQSSEVGFDAVQLSLSTVPDTSLFLTMKARAEQLGLEVVVGVHDSAQLQQAIEFGTTIVGINNRDIKALELDCGKVDRTESLISKVPDDILVISESAMLSVQDVTRAAKAGAAAVLVGTAIARSDDPAVFVRQLCQSLAAAA